MDLLKALYSSPKLITIQSQGHQKDSPIQKGNSLADRMVREVAITSTLASVLEDPGSQILPDKPKYTQEDLT